CLHSSRALYFLLIFCLSQHPPSSPPFPYTTLFRSDCLAHDTGAGHPECPQRLAMVVETLRRGLPALEWHGAPRATRGQLLRAHRSEEHTLNSSHVKISYAVFCLKKKKNTRVASFFR